MALGFFRRYQKVVLLVMVLLMCMWGLTTSIRGCTGERGRDPVLGHLGKSEITLTMVQQALRQMDLLETWLQLDRRQGLDEFVAIIRYNSREDRREGSDRQERQALAWLLLGREARQMGVRVTNGQIDSFLAALGYSGKDYERLLANLRADNVTEKQFRQAVGDFLAIREAYAIVAPPLPMSIAELRHTFRLLSEKLELDMVAFKAEDFVKDVKDPTQAEVLAQFNAYKGRFPNQASGEGDFGFGYRRGNRAKVSYLFFDQGAIERAVEPGDTEMMGYWRQHRGSITRRVPVPATSTAPSTGPSTRPDEPEYREEPVETYSAAKDQIRRVLRPAVAQRRLQALIARAVEVLGPGGGGDGGYDRAVAKMTLPAGPLLDRRVGALTKRSATLEAVIAQLEDSTGVKIVYPTGTHDKRTLDPQVKLTVEADWSGLTLGAVLEKIGELVKSPGIQWVSFETFDNAIFPSAPVAILPARAGTTKMLDLDEIARDSLLGSATLTDPAAGRGGGETLLQIIETAEEFDPEARTRKIKKGEDYGQPLYVTDDRTGRLLWRLDDAASAQAAAVLDEDVQKRAAEDWKTVQAFGAARSAAEVMLARLQAGGDLAELAGAAKREVVHTGPFSRLGLQMNPYAQFGGSPVLMVMPPVAEAGVSPAFMEAAFKLAPADPSSAEAATRPATRPATAPATATAPTTQAATAPAGKVHAAVVPLQRQRKVLLIVRTGYAPPLERDFVGGGAGYMARFIPDLRRQQAEGLWFRLPNVAERVGYVPHRPQR